MAFAVGFLTAASSPSFAQGLPATLPTALGLALAENSVRVSYAHRQLIRLKDGAELDAGPDRLLRVDALAVAIPYGLTQRTTVSVGAPYLWRRLDGSEGTRSTSGFGDAFVQIKRRFWSHDFPKGTTRLAAFARASLPTGKTREDDTPLPVPLRLGKGVVDLSGTAVLSHLDDRLGVTAVVGYSVATGSHAGARPGDRFRYGLALGYRLLPMTYTSLDDDTWVSYLEIRGRVEASASRESRPVPNSGGHTLLLAPTLQFVPTPTLLFEATFQIPVLRQLDGEQLGPDWSASLGGRVNMYFLGR